MLENLKQYSITPTYETISRNDLSKNFKTKKCTLIWLRISLPNNYYHWSEINNQFPNTYKSLNTPQNEQWNAEKSHKISIWSLSVYTRPFFLLFSTPIATITFPGIVSLLHCYDYRSPRTNLKDFPNLLIVILWSALYLLYGSLYNRYGQIKQERGWNLFSLLPD